MMEERVRKLLHRLEEVEALLGDPEVVRDQDAYRRLTQEHAYLGRVREVSDRLKTFQRQLEEDRQLLQEESEPELAPILREEIADLEAKVQSAEGELGTLLVPPDPRDNRNVILEIRAGTGGEEAALFVADCVRMYQNWANRKGWKCELLSCSSSDQGGYKECIMGVSGNQVFRFLQYEAGTHRVQRVPKTEAQGRIHTSAVTVAVLLEPDETEKVVLDERELRIETYRASGAGGQHVNVTDSAVRIVHLPTGTVVTCQEERSQHKNKEKAMRLLSARIAEEQRRKAQEEMAQLRSSQVGSGDRSERIRTYNFPQNRVTDHRVHITLHSLDRVLEGDLDALAQALVAHYHQQKLS